MDVVNTGGGNVVNSTIASTVVDFIASGVVGTVQLVSSSGQSTIPSHQLDSLMQVPLVGHIIVPSGQGLQTHPHCAVISAVKPFYINITYF